MLRLLTFIIAGFIFCHCGTVYAAEQEVVIEALRVDPLQFNAATGLTVEPVLASEAGEFRFEYRWFLNGEESPFETSEHFPGNLLHRDDEVSVEVIPLDVHGERFPSYVTLPLKAVNTSPTITSKPPTKLNDQEFRYRVKASDPDGDNITFRLEGNPEGMEIDCSTGQIVWPLEVFPEGEYSVRVIAEDGFGGQAEQNFELSLSLEPKRNK